MNEFEDVEAYDVMRKYIKAGKLRYICDIIIIKENEALCRAECIDDGTKFDWTIINDTLNPQFAYGEYLLQQQTEFY